MINLKKPFLILITCMWCFLFIKASSISLSVPVDPETRYRLLQTDALINQWQYNRSITSGYQAIEYTMSIDQINFDRQFYQLEPTPSAPNIDWFTSYRGERNSKEAHGHFILACSDGGFLQIGESGSPVDSGRILIIKVSSEGELLWRQENDLFIRGSFNIGNSAIEIEDGYIVVGGQQSGNNSSSQNSLIAKLDKITGDIIFIKNTDNGGVDAFEHIATNLNGFIAVGYRDAEDPENTFFTEGKGHLTFLDQNGLKLTELDLSDYLSQAYRSYPTHGGYIISGQAEENQQFGLLKIDNTGSIFWYNTYGFESTNGSADDDHCFALDVAADGSIFLGGHTRFGYRNNGSARTNNWDTLTYKIDSLGNTIWSRRNGNPRGFDARYIHDEAWGIKATPDGGCVVVAGSGDEYGSYSQSNQNGLSDKWVVYLIKYASDGVREWQTTFGDPGENLGWDWAGEDIALTSDGCAIIAVDNASFGFLKTTKIYNP